MSNKNSTVKNKSSDSIDLIARASIKSIKTSPQKANLVLDLIRGLNAEEALNALEFSNKRISNEIKKVLKSAISNAENNHQLDIDKLIVHEASVGKSMVMKRFRPRARGRSGKILKPFSNIRIIVKEKEISQDKVMKNDVASKKNLKSNEKNDEIKENQKLSEKNIVSKKDSKLNESENNGTKS